MLNPTPRAEHGLDYRKLAEAIPALIWLSDADGRILFANRRWADFTGVEITDLAPGEVGATLFHPEDAERVAAAWHRVADGSGWIGGIEGTQFADLIDLVVLTTSCSIRDDAAAWLREHLDRSREGKARWRD